MDNGDEDNTTQHMFQLFIDNYDLESLENCTALIRVIYLRNTVFEAFSLLYAPPTGPISMKLAGLLRVI